MGTYNLPRNVKGEGRILFVFSTKALIYTLGGAVIGLPFYFLFDILRISIVGIIIVGILALLGFAIATFKIPEIPMFEVTKSISGEKIDDVIIRYFKFKRAKNKIYIYKDNNDSIENIEDKNEENKSKGED